MALRDLGNWQAIDARAPRPLKPEFTGDLADGLWVSCRSPMPIQHS